MKRFKILALAVLLSIPALSLTRATIPSGIEGADCPDCGPVPQCPIDHPDCDPGPGK